MAHDKPIAFRSWQTKLLSISRRFCLYMFERRGIVIASNAVASMAPVSYGLLDLNHELWHYTVFDRKSLYFTWYCRWENFLELLEHQSGSKLIMLNILAFSKRESNKSPIFVRHSAFREFLSKPSGENDGIA